MRPAISIAILLFSVLLVACNGDGDDGPSDNGADVAVATRPPNTAPPQPPGTPEPQGTTALASDEPVAFATEDGVTLKGHFFSTPGPKRRVVVIAHEPSKDQRAWRNFARELTAQGLHVMTFDFRGYGESVGNKDTARLDRDLESAVRFVRSRDYPLIYIVGGHAGGTAAIKVAARLELQGVVAISAPVTYMGLDAKNDIANVRENKLFVVTRNDPEGTAAASTYMNSSMDPKQLRTLDGGGLGSDLLQGVNGATFKQLVSDFLVQ